MANEIFISYSRKDMDKVSAIKKEIDETLRIDCWMDLNGIESGDEFKRVIITAINRHTVVLFMLSENSQKSPWALKELNFAEKKNKKVVLVNIDGCEMTDDFAFDFSDHDIIVFDNALQHDKLIRDLRDWLDIPEDDGFQEVRGRMDELKADYNLVVIQQEAIDKEIREKQKLLGEKEFICPVCDKANEVEAQYCQRCGYILNYFTPRSFEEERRNLLRRNWKTNLQVNTYRSQFVNIKKELENIDKELKLGDSLLKSKNIEIQNISQQLEIEKKQNSEERVFWESEIQKCQSEYVALKSKYEEEAKASAEMKKIIEEIEKKEREEEAKRLAAEEENKKTVREFNVNGVSFKMIRVEGGTFQMGATSEQRNDADDDESPVHIVTLNDYRIGETEVTQELWKAVMGNNPSKYKGSKNPVENVSWLNCHSFIEKLNSLTGENFRLPAEAEWEFAARGGNKSQHYKYSGSNLIDEVAWFFDNSNGKSHPVGTKKPNELGLFDMSGNVWEWCEDLFRTYNHSDDIERDSRRVLRGGVWNSKAKYCRVSTRNYRHAVFYNFIVGFRLAL
jgi:formylglycine-generating enzyme required for sulfatase activity